MKIIHVGLGLLVIAPLMGCATGAQRQVEAIKGAGPQITACVQQIYNAPEATVLRAHFPMNPENASLAQLSDQSLATKPETDAIVFLYPRLQECRRAQVAALLPTAPTVVPILIKAHSGADDDVTQLVQRKMSWGEVVRRQRDRQMAAATQAAAALQMEHHNEVAARQAALKDLSVALANAADRVDPARYRTYPPTPVIIPPNYAGTGTIVPGTVRINCTHAGVTCY